MAAVKAVGENTNTTIVKIVFMKAGRIPTWILEKKFAVWQVYM